MIAKGTRYQTSSRWTIFVVTMAMVVLAASENANGDGGTRWYQVGLATGEVEGYQWAVGAKGMKHEPLAEICALASLTEPPNDGVDFVEGTDATICGKLMTPMESVVASPAFGSGESRLVILAAIYRPIVRRVTFFLNTGGRRVFQTRLAKVPNRRAKGIPRFRYLVAPFKGETCVRKISTFDGNGNLVHDELRPSCRQGGNL
jgi:hypothetical protein